MKYLNLVLLSTFAFFSCGKEDATGPTIVIEIANEIQNKSTIDLDISIQDDSKVNSYDFKITDSTNDLFSIYSKPNELEVDREEQVFIDTPDDVVKLIVLSEDDLGNQSTFEKTIQIVRSVGGGLDLNFKLLYEDQPLVMFTPITYTTGETITFTRVSTYISDLKLNDNLLQDIDFLRLHDAHLDAETAQNGYTYSLRGIEAGNYTVLDFNYGISPSDNANRPADYASGHPLAESGEYWVSWNSYIFVKIEGRIDTDNDGIPDDGFALHLGSNDAMREASLNSNIDIVLDQVSQKDIYIDLKEVLGGDSNPYNLIEDGQIHSLDQISLINLLANNLKTNTK